MGLLSAWLAASAAWAGPVPMLLVDPELRVTPVLVDAIGPRSVRLAGVEGAAPRSVPWSEIAGLWSAARPDSGLRGDESRLELVDGQVLLSSGVLRAAAEAEGVDLVADHAGSVRVPLEWIDRVHLPHPLVVDVPAPSRQDRIVRTNGDVRDGFVVSIGGVVEIEADGVVSSFSAEDLVLIDLANPVEPVSAPLLVFADGSAIAAELRESDGAWTVAFVPVLSGVAGGGETEAAMVVEPRVESVDGLVALLPGGASGRLVPVSALPLESVTPAAGLVFAEPVRTGKADLGAARASPLTIGPGEARWALPAGAAAVRLGAGLAADPDGWAGCAVVLEAIDAAGMRTALARASLDGGGSGAELRAALPEEARTLAVRVEPGPRGPVRDLVTLSRAVVLVRE